METAEKGVVRNRGSAQNEDCGSDRQTEETEQQVKGVQAERDGMTDGLQQAAVTTV